MTSQWLQIHWNTVQKRFSSALASLQLCRSAHVSAPEHVIKAVKLCKRRQKKILTLASFCCDVPGGSTVCRSVSHSPVHTRLRQWAKTQGGGLLGSLAVHVALRQCHHICTAYEYMQTHRMDMTHEERQTASSTFYFPVHLKGTSRAWL